MSAQRYPHRQLLPLSIHLYKIPFMPKGKYLAEFEQYVLLSLLRLGDDAYGAAVRRDIEGTTGRPVSIGAVYATLGRLSDKGLVESWESEPEPVPGGRSRKHFRVTSAGDRALRHSVGMLQRMLSGLGLGGEK